MSDKNIANRDYEEAELPSSVVDMGKKLLDDVVNKEDPESSLSMNSLYRFIKKGSRPAHEDKEFLSLRVRSEKRNPTNWETRLCRIFSKNIGIEFSSVKSDGDENGYFVISGERNDVTYSACLLRCCVEVIEKKVWAHKRALSLSTGEANDYRMRVIDSLEEKMRTAKEKFEKEKT